MFQFPLLSSMLQGSGKGMPADQIQPEGGLMALLRGLDDETAGFTGELQAMLMQLAPPVLQRLDELLAGGTSLPQAANTLLREFAVEADGQPFPELLQALAQQTKGPNAAQMPAPPQAAASQVAMPQVATPRVATPQVAASQAGVSQTESLPVEVAGAEPVRAEPVPRLRATVVPPLPADGAPNTPAGTATTNPLNTLAAGMAALPQGVTSAAPPSSMSPQLAGSLLDMGVPQQVGSKTWSEAVAQRVMWMVQGDQQVARLKLNPPNLGPLEVRVSVSQEQTNVAFLAQHAAVREALEAALPRLREMFDQSSLQLVRADVSDPGAQQGGRSGQSTADHGSRHGAGPGAQAGDPEFPGDQPLDTGGSGLVDLFA